MNTPRHEDRPRRAIRSVRALPAGWPVMQPRRTSQPRLWILNSCSQPAERLKTNSLQPSELVVFMRLR